MCGITGFFDPKGFDAEYGARLAQSMAGTLTHRGPDDGGTWVEAATGIALAHRRLSIVDLTPAGHQPPCSESGRYIISYNGEIYNHQELRKELQAAGHG